jgi:hypothetical protein
MFRRSQRFTAWIALLAMLALAVLPSVSHALAFARGGAAGWVEVCTPQGMRLVAVDAADASAPAEPGPPLQAASFLEHCTLCTLALDVPALPAPEPAALLLPLGRQALPWAFLHAPRTLHAWRSAQPRGPPSVS